MTYVKYKFNAAKALNAILLIAERQPGITLHQLLKVIFYADKAHLNQYGRPVIGDQYSAMTYGPVPSATYSMLKDDPVLLEELELESYPFRRESNKHVYADAEPDMRHFSDSDVDALTQSLSVYGKMGFGELTHLTHKDPAWANADGHWMNYADFIDDGPDKDAKVEYLVETSPRVVL